MLGRWGVVEVDDKSRELDPHADQHSTPSSSTSTPLPYFKDGNVIPKPTQECKSNFHTLSSRTCGCKEAQTRGGRVAATPYLFKLRLVRFRFPFDHVLKLGKGLDHLQG
jgi:hypothetical protein